MIQQSFLETRGTSTLVLEIQDLAISDDPMTQFLERRGWTQRLIEQVKASIAEKLTPDMFTGKTTELTGLEINFQTDCDRYYLELASLRS